MNNLVAQNENVALFDTAHFEHMQRIATAMSEAKLVPQHLHKSMPDCLMICQQANRWQMDPFALAQSTYVLHGKFGYEGKLIAAVVNSRAGLAERLSYEFWGEGDDLEVTVSAKFQHEHDARTVKATVKEAKSQSSGNKKWDEIPDQMLCYYGARKWARRHAPELMLGVMTEDEISQPMRDVTPEPVDVEAEGIQGTGEVEPGTGNGYTITEQTGVTTEEDELVPAKPTRKRIKITFQGQDYYKTKFMTDVGQMLREVDDDGFDQLVDDIEQAVASIEDDEAAQEISSDIDELITKAENRLNNVNETDNAPKTQTLNLAEE